MDEQTQEQKILNCTHRHPDGRSAWKEIYYGIACELCGLFYPDNSNWFAPLDDEEDEYHPYNCICEDCLQNHPERDILYGDGTYFNYPNDDDDDELEDDCS